jgi:Fe-S-cluster containining protein
LSINHIIKKLSDLQRFALYEKLNKLYQDFEHDFEGIPKPCTQCGSCCHFDTFGHKLYISSLEFAYVSEHKLIPEIVDHAHCPFLKGQLCEARDFRMLGCRTFFRLHQPEDTEKAQTLYETYLKKLKDLYLANDIQWEYKDLMVFVKDFSY